MSLNAQGRDVAKDLTAPCQISHFKARVLTKLRAAFNRSHAQGAALVAPKPQPTTLGSSLFPAGSFKQLLCFKNLSRRPPVNALTMKLVATRQP